MDELIENVILIEEDDANPDPDLLSFQDLKSDPGRVLCLSPEMVKMNFRFWHREKQLKLV